MNETKINELLRLAENAMKSAYAPYSDCSVGAALLCRDGKIFTGANIENASFSPTVCAERVAFFSAVHQGEREFSAIAVVGGKGGVISGFFPPCGVCRQVMREFCDIEDFEVIIGGKEQYKVLKLKELLPFSFGSSDMK